MGHRVAIKGGAEGWEGLCSGWAGPRPWEEIPASSLSRNCKQVDTHGAFRFCLKMSSLCHGALESGAQGGGDRGAAGAVPLSSQVTWDNLLHVSRQSDLICKIRLVTILQDCGEGNKCVLVLLLT